MSDSLRYGTDESEIDSKRADISQKRRLGRWRPESREDFPVECCASEQIHHSHVDWKVLLLYTSLTPERRTSDRLCCNSFSGGTFFTAASIQFPNKVDDSKVFEARFYREAVLGSGEEWVKLRPMSYQQAEPIGKRSYRTKDSD